MTINENPLTEIGVYKDEILKCCQRNIRNNKMIFLAAGRIIYRKGYEFLLDAIDNLPIDLDYCCRIVGDGEDLDKLKAKCNQSLNLMKHVVFVGKVPYTKMEIEYRNADVFVMPSLRETTGSVLLEAMSKGIPVITIGRFGGAILLNHDTGWLYDGYTRDEFIHNLAAIFIECINNPEEVKRRGINARNQAKLYTWEEKIKHYESIYRSILMD